MCWCAPWRLDGVPPPLASTPSCKSQTLFLCKLKKKRVPGLEIGNWPSKFLFIATFIGPHPSAVQGYRLCTGMYLFPTRSLSSIHVKKYRGQTFLFIYARKMV
jgi:hypothetical protein